MRYFGRVFLITFALTLVAGITVAQEQTGAIEGLVVDADGPLPGVRVEAVGASGTKGTVTDSEGRYRFRSVLPGGYTCTASLQSYITGMSSDVTVTLGGTVQIDFTLQPAEFTGEIVVTSDQPINVTSNSTAVSIGGEYLENLPKGRNFTSVVAAAPGASDEDFLAGISIDGASGAENRFIIDGIDTTSAYTGESAQPIVTDFIEEVQVKSAGYAAEYGGSLGGVINAVTKSGSNEFHGFVGAYYTPSDWEGIGGPILRDKLWFFAAYMPALTDIKRTPDGSTITYPQDREVQYLSANLTGTLGSSFMYKASYNSSEFTRENVLPSRDGSTSPDADLVTKQVQPRENLSLYLDWVATENILVSGRLGTFMFDTLDTGFDATERIYFRGAEWPGDPSDPRYQPAYWLSIPADSFWASEFDKWEREAAGIDATFFFSGAGEHSLKVGGQYELIKNSVSYGENGAFYTFRWGLPDRFGQGVQGTAGSLSARRYRTEGGAESKNYALFLQDAWQVVPNLTLNIGVRAEQERVPNYGYATDPTLPKYAMSWDFGDKLAPRLGFAWDVFSDAKLKIYGSYGTYYDITKLAMPRGSFGADKWIDYLYPIDSIDYLSMLEGCHLSTNDIFDNVCPQLGDSVNLDLRRPTNPYDAIDPNLQPMENRAYQVGAEYMLTPKIVLGARLVNKTLINTIEDIGYLECVGSICSEVYTTGNPGKGIVAGDPDGDGPIPPQAEAIRDYQAVELIFNRRFANNWMLYATYVYSELTGNYSGLASSDEFGRNDPNIERYFDGLAYGFDSQGDLVDDVLNTDRTNAIEVSGMYTAPFGLNVGLSTSWRTGGPRTTLASYNGVEFYPYGRNDMGRSPSITRTDLYLAYQFRLGGQFALELSLNVLNLFDESTPTRYGTYAHHTDICDATAACDASNEWYFGELVPYDLFDVMGPADEEYYGKEYDWQDPRVVRGGIKFIF